MRVSVKIDDNLSNDEIIINCSKKNDQINKIISYLKNIDSTILVYKDNQELYLNQFDILFFETNDNSISAHTIDNSFIIKNKLYELEQLLPNYFVRISKSTIVNINHILAININITSSSLIEFKNTYKKTYVSRFYLKQLKEKMKER